MLRLILILSIHIYCFTFTSSSTCSLFYIRVFISRYLHRALHLHSERTQNSPKILMIIKQYIHKALSTRNISSNLPIFSTNIKTTNEVNKSLIYFYLFTINVLFKYWCKLPDSDPQERVETYGRFSVLIVKPSSAFVRIFLNFIYVMSKVGGLVVDELERVLKETVVA